MRGALILTICLLVVAGCKKEIVDIEANFTINGEDKIATVDVDNPPNIFTDADKVVHVEQNQKVIFKDKSEPIEAVHQRTWSISNMMTSKTEAEIDYKFKELGPHPVVLEANGERIMKWVNVYHPAEGPPDGSVTFSAVTEEPEDNNSLVVLDRPEDKERKAKEAEQRRLEEAENRRKAELKAEEERRERERQYELERKQKEKSYAADQKKREEDRKKEQARLEQERQKEQERLAAERKKEDARIAAQQKDDKAAKAELERIERERKAEDERRKKAQAEEDRKRKEAERLETERLEKERKAKEAAALKAKEEADRKAREEAERKAKEEADRKAKEEAARNAISLENISFTASSKEVLIGDIITFKDNTSPNTSIEKRVWEFGDGQVRNSSSASTTYAYRKPGTYTVSLCINGRSDLCKEMQIKVNPIVKAPVATGEFKCSTKSTAGALSSRICSSAGSEDWSNGSIITLKPKVRMELIEAKVKVDKGGSVSVTLLEGNEELGESSAYVNKGLSQLVLSDLYVTMDAGKTYKLKIAPSSGQNLENISNCNPGGSSGPHFDLNYGGQIILFDIKYCYE